MGECEIRDAAALPSPSGMVLVHLSSRYIEEYLGRHPVIWPDKTLTVRGGPGDRAGKTPTPAMAEALWYLHAKGDLFTQRELWDHVQQQEVWGDWLDSLPEEQRKGVAAKLYGNYYPAFVDQLHAWALLSDSHWFDLVEWSSAKDATGSVDLTCRRGETEYRIALYGPGRRAEAVRQYKVEHRGAGLVQTVPVQMPITRPPGPGNKRWYVLDDFEALRPRSVA